MAFRDSPPPWVGVGDHEQCSLCVCICQDKRDDMLTSFLRRLPQVGNKSKLVRQEVWFGLQEQDIMLVQQHGFTVRSGQNAAAAQQGSFSSTNGEALESARSTQVFKECRRKISKGA